MSAERGPRPTLTLLTDRASAESRLRLASACASHLRRYRDDFHELERRPNVDARMTERAYRAEGQYRILAKTALDALNDLRDASILPHLLGTAALPTRRADTEALVQAIRTAQAFLTERYPDVDFLYLEEMATIVKASKLEIVADERVATAHFWDERMGQQRSLRIRPQPASGDPGRVSSDDFFKESSAAIFGRLPGLFDAGDCHVATARGGPSLAQEVPLYAALTNALAAGRELMYHHAREVEELGPAFVRGSAPVAIGAIILFVMAAIAIGIGTTIIVLCQTKDITDNNVCAIGIMLTFIGVALVGGGMSASGNPNAWVTGPAGSVPINNPTQ